MNVRLLSQKKEDVRNYYGKILKTNRDLKTSACCTTESFPDHLKSVIKNIELEIREKFYGCGFPIPNQLRDCTVLDLGCGSGRDAYILSSLVGENGHVTGIDMTDEQLTIAKKYINVQTRKFGYTRPNVDFRMGYIEYLREAGIEDNSIDVVISNCVINLSPDKLQVFKEIFRVLKPGGELYFSDIFTSARVSQEFHDDALAYGECLGGAQYIEDFRRLLIRLGCPDYRVVVKRKIEIDDPSLSKKAGAVEFYSMTIRAFKLDDLEDRCEDFGQVAYYLGSMEGCPHKFILDDHHLFVTGKPALVCGNTASMLGNTRFGKHFKIAGGKDKHFGLFPCGPVLNEITATGSCC
ncbi:MAG: methyltransferase domain-containing protein [Candidatus Loosdrechtia sp.]|uniref:methyltransferase domain-containing protein n=1 Tax=Candidatus Loosdrechtia sp. TaxID=3101272 RepID=UPI003A62575A|nr:MAG: methyltransferase domain-containing protein [Candidatus Jettenia sp. AMX2]